MKIQLTKPLKNSPFIDNGLNTFKDIDCLYLNDINTSLIKAYYYYFRYYFQSASMKMIGNLPKRDTVETAQESNQEFKLQPSQIALIILDGNQELIDKVDKLLLRVCYKDENLKNRLTEIDLEQLDIGDWEALISNFLHAFWSNRWLTGTKTN